MSAKPVKGGTKAKHVKKVISGPRNEVKSSPKKVTSNPNSEVKSTPDAPSSQPIEKVHSNGKSISANNLELGPKPSSVRKLTPSSAGSSKERRKTEFLENEGIAAADRRMTMSPRHHEVAEQSIRLISSSEQEESDEEAFGEGVAEAEENGEFLEELHHGHSEGYGFGFPRESFMELPYDFDPDTTAAVYHVGSTGDIINDVVISDPEFSIPSCSSSEYGNNEQREYGGEDYWEEEYDEEEDDFRRFSAYFAEAEQSLTDAEYDEIREGLEILTRTKTALGPGRGFHFHTMDMSERQLEDLFMVEHFQSLRSLNISKNCLKSVRGLGSMRQLVKVDASRNQIEEFLDIYSEQSMPLREANFSRNQISKILDLKPFWALTVVNLSYNKLVTVDGFEMCTYLRVLNLSHNSITEIKNLSCPNLVILLLKFNELTTIEGIVECGNLRYLSISNNQISELHHLKCLPELMELRCQDNKIEDLLELEHLKSLIYLSHLCLQPNPCMEVGMSRSLLIHMLPQVRYLDGVQVTPDEILEARNTFNPSYIKLAFEDHTNAMLEKACQSSNDVFDEFCEVHPIPPIILLVGSSKGNLNRLGTFLKERFRHDVILGGVHSTATTIDGGNLCNVDIPVSYESFLEMKNRGEFLATSHILGRVCGFATSQIAHAAEKGALLVATVPLVTAICIRKWRFCPKNVLILPSDPPHFNVDDFIRTRNEKIKIEKARSEEFEDEEEETPGEQSEEDDTVAPRHSRIVSFAAYALPEAHHTAESAVNFLTPAAILKYSIVSNDDTVAYLDTVTESLLNRSSSFLFDVSQFDVPDEASEVIRNPHLEFQPEQRDANVLQAEYSEESRPDGERAESFNPQGFLESNFENEEMGEYNDAGDLYRYPIYSRHPLHLMKETPPFTVTNRLRRLRRLASVLLIQAGETKPSEYVPDIMMNLPGIQPLESEVKDTIDWKKTILQNSLYNSILETDEAYYMVLAQTTTTNETPEPMDTLRGTLMPHRTSFAFENTGNTMHFPVYGNGKAQEDEKKSLIENFSLLYVSEDEKPNDTSKVGQPSTVLEHPIRPGHSESHKEKKGVSIVAFSETNLKEIKTEKSRGSYDEYIADKIRTRKKTGFNRMPPKPPPVAFSQPNLDDLASKKERERHSNAHLVSSKIQKRKHTAFSRRTYLSDETISDDSVKDSGLDEDGSGSYIVNEYMNYEDESEMIDDLDESEELIKDNSSELDHNASSEKSRFKHRDALELSILKIREEYHNFHLEHPGFFSAVIDTADFEKSSIELEAIAREMIRDYKNELKSAGKFMKTYAGMNVVDEESFIKERAEFLKWCTHEWDKGYQHPLQHMKDKFGVDHDSRTFFETRRRPDNILDPTLPRHHSSAKIRQLIRVAQHHQNKIARKNAKAKEKNILQNEVEDVEVDEFEFEEDLEAFLQDEEEDSIEGEDTEEYIGEFGMNGGSFGEFHGEGEYGGEIERDEYSHLKGVMD